MSNLNERDAKIVQYLNEAHGKERELESSLQSHIEMTDKMSYKKRLRQHLTETRHHAKEIEKRLRQLGAGNSILAEGAQVVQDAVGVGKAIAKAPVEVLRGGSDQETMLTNARNEFMKENEEIAMYRSLEAFAEKAGDAETAKLARSIVRDEERMAKFLEREVQTLAKAVATEQVPADQRRRAGTRARSRGATNGRSRRTAAAAR